MFAYPSGDIHMGHFRNYIIGDSVTRYRLMKGHDVLFPFGWMRSACLQKTRPSNRISIREVDAQQREGIAKHAEKNRIIFDWDREVTTCLPDYYKWTQWFFRKIIRKGSGLQGILPRQLVPGLQDGPGKRTGRDGQVLEM